MSFDADTDTDTIGRPAELESSFHVARALGAQSCSILEEPPSYVLVRTIVVRLLNDSMLPKLLIDFLERSKCVNNGRIVVFMGNR